ncbi:hypothetical protein [Rubritalea sp.]|uniref:hypothetical protein n=1 Tax=Rubritalea sp. TaxID=2109375 RepID=UPI003EF8FE25
MRTKPVGISAAASIKDINDSWHEDLPVEYLAAHSRGLPWHMIVPAALLGLLLFLGMVGLLLQTEERAVVALSASEVAAEVGVEQINAVSTMSKLQRIARVEEYLNELSTCTSIDELEPKLRSVPQLREKMENYYKTNALSFKKVRSVNELYQISNDLDGGYLCSAVYTDGLIQLSVILEREGEVRLDWESFVAYSDIPWDEIKKRLPREPIKVRAIRSISEYYNYGFDSATYQCFELMRNDSNTRFYAYARRDGALLSQLLPLGVSAGMIEMTLKVHYPENVIDDRLLIIDSVESDSWVVDYKK